MFIRDITPVFTKLLNQYPVVTVTGPRQSGKTTLVINNCPDKAYFSLEDPDTYSFIQADPKKFLTSHKKGVILDEIQKYPELLSYMQTIVDKEQQSGMYILTGSHQLALHNSISQSLAGRTAIVDLYPLSNKELIANNIVRSNDELILTGMYPAIYAKDLEVNYYYRNYVATYVERDVRQIINVKNLNMYQKFISLVAGRIGSILNAESLANDVGIAGVTVNEWLSLLEASFLIIRLQPYYENFGKRVLKSPKIYFTDTGLACFLLGIETTSQLTRDRLLGGLFENYVLLELVKYKTNLGREAKMFYHRDNNNREVDVIIKNGNNLYPVEIKATSTFNMALLKNLKYYMKLTKDRSPCGFLVYNGDLEQQIDNIYILNAKNASKIYEYLT